MNLHEEMRAMGDRAVAAAHALAPLSSRRKNALLDAMADELDAQRGALLQANAADLAAARAAGLPPALCDRLQLDQARVDAMIKGLHDIIALKDPIGTRLNRWLRPNGLEIHKIRVPIGVIAILYEARPNVTADAAALCLKAANAVILRGGSEALRSNQAIVAALQAGGARKGLPPDAIQLVTTADRDAVRELVQLEDRVDLVIPRGGAGLIRAVVEQAYVPVIKHYQGVCQVVVDAAADERMALEICENAKCQRPGVCNAIEKVLVHENIAAEFLPRLVARLGARGVTFRGDAAALRIVPAMAPATAEDWSAEYLDLILTVGVVPDVQAAVTHINRHGSHHSDAIITADKAAQQTFMQGVDSAAVYVNASTRFTDGGEFGMGAEIGISTDKLHARGPMGLEELTSYKYLVWGTGQVRA